MEIFLLVLAAVVVLVVAVQRGRGQGGASGGSQSSVLDTFEKAFRGIGDLVGKELSDDVLVLENNVLAAVFATGVRTRRTRSLLFGNTITVSISEVGAKALKPVRAIVEDEIMLDIVEKARKEGYTIAGEPRLLFVVDRSMAGFEAKVRTAVDEATPVTTVAASPSGMRPQARDAQVSLHWIGGGVAPFVLPVDGSEQVVGRSSSCDWQVDSPLVSGRHLLVSVATDGRPAALRVVDAGSVNKTTVDGSGPLVPGQVYEVGHGSEFKLGPHVRIRVLMGRSVHEDTAPTNGTHVGS
ncbi:FHA domain-containing protein [Nocardioides zhouii]|uniref:FHA domain-containing protein n=1 Tax=Nocardioides zhouii TaxID=1168729 RepID=A0A4Q2SNS8_9ACTN|nr:FHA domain-containing protein [Nocardioides zhouii]RYC05728.1 FHA domain-containing protein [Nocardioides zhouii]